MSESKPRFTCSWVWDLAVVLSDGKVVCGCADPYGDRPIGHLKDSSMKDIWNSDLVRKIRRDLNDGYSPFCLDCGLKQFVDEKFEIPQRPEIVENVPRLFIEPTVVCNLSCFEAVCNKESGIVGSRSKKMMPLDEFKKLVDDTGAHLGRVDLFNYGDPFVHPKCIDMIEYIKTNYPHVYLYISTNGLPIKKRMISRLVESGLDEITFSVDGPDQETYVQYRKGGKLGKVLKIMEVMVEERNRQGRLKPFINWRYILFKWNCSDEQMERTRKMAADMGVDKLVWEITDHPEAAKSDKYQVGTENWKEIYHEIWDTSQTCNAIPGKKLLATISPPQGVLETESDKPLAVRVGVRNIGGAKWHRDFPGSVRTVRLGAQLHDENKQMLDLNYARAFLPADIYADQEEMVDIELPAIEKPGKYMLRFDMCYEGIDWFDSGGSEVAWREFRVKKNP